MKENNQMIKNENERMFLRLSNSERKYSCKECGKPFDANAPDDVHRFSSVYQCWKFDWIERKYLCPNCNKSTILYWHSEVHKYHDYATPEEMKRKTSKENLGNHSDFFERMTGH